jgi:hypothetical protein
MARKKTANEPAPDANRAIEALVVAFAEQLGRMVGTVERKTTGWLDMATLSDQLTRIRDGAADLLSHLSYRGGTSHGEPGYAAAATVETPAADLVSESADAPVSRVARRKPSTARPAAKPRAATVNGRSRQHVAAEGKGRRKPRASVAGANPSEEEIPDAITTDRHRRARGR